MASICSISFIFRLSYLPTRFTHQGYGCLWELCCLLPACPLDTPLYRIPVRQATSSLLLLLYQGSPPETCKSLRGSSATTPLVDFHHRCMTCPSYKKTEAANTTSVFLLHSLDEFTSQQRLSIPPCRRHKPPSQRKRPSAPRSDPD